MAFHGTFEHSLDAKNRLTVPSKFRAALAGKVFLVRGPDRCISLYPEATYSALTTEALAGHEPVLRRRRASSSGCFHSTATDTELDSAGRVMLTPRHLEHASIDREVVITGAGDCLELWDRSAWEAYDRDLSRRAPDLTASLGHPA